MKQDSCQEANITKSFGIIKRKLTGQQFKDNVREGWQN